MKIFKFTNNFKDKIEVEASLVSACDLVDKCLEAALTRPNLKEKSPAEAWFEIQGDNFLVSITMDETKSNFVYLSERNPVELPKEKSKGFFGKLKAASSAMSAKDLTGLMSKDELVAFLNVVFTGDFEMMWSSLQGYAM